MPCARDGVQALEHEAPRLAVVGHVFVLVTVKLSRGELLVDELRDGHTRLFVLRQQHVTERSKRGLLRWREEPQLSW